MKTKYKGWKEGIISADLRSLGGGGHRKGDVVRWKVLATVPDADGVRLTNYEYHVVNTNNMELTRTPHLKIDGLELKNYWNETEK